jgi:hypothetical protein
VVSTDIGLIFWDIEQGVYATNGSKINRLSDNMGPLLRAAAGFPELAMRAAATFFDGSYYLSLSTDGNSFNRTIEYDTVGEAWWVHDCTAHDWAVLDPLSNPTLYAVDGNTVRVQRMFVDNTFTDAGERYAGGTFLTGSWDVWGAPHTAKRVREVRIDGTGNWVLGYATDFSDDFTYEAGEIWFTTAENPMLFAPTANDGHIFAPSTSQGDLFAPTTTVVTDRRYHTLGRANAWSFQVLNDDTGDFQMFSETVSVTGRTD